MRKTIKLTKRSYIIHRSLDALWYAGNEKWEWCDSLGNCLCDSSVNDYMAWYLSDEDYAAFNKTEKIMITIETHPKGEKFNWVHWNIRWAAPNWLIAKKLIPFDGKKIRVWLKLL